LIKALIQTATNLKAVFQSVVRVPYFTFIDGINVKNLNIKLKKIKSILYQVSFDFIDLNSTAINFDKPLQISIFQTKI